jgi:hypothetical protein
MDYSRHFFDILLPYIDIITAVRLFRLKCWRLSDSCSFLYGERAFCGVPFIDAERRQSLVQFFGFKHTTCYKKRPV